MKYCVPLILFIASISALPQVQDGNVLLDRNLLTNQIEEAIREFSQSIIDAGLDPFVIRRESTQYAHPVPAIFNTAVVVDDITSFGLSDIRINNLSYHAFSSFLSFDLEMPHIHFSVGSAVGQVTVFDNRVDGNLDGSLDIKNIRIRGNVQINVSIITGVTIRDVAIDFTLGSIDSRIAAVVGKFDLSDYINSFLGQTVPNTLHQSKSDVDTLLGVAVRNQIESYQ